MADFMIQFLLCNIWISGIIGILLLGLLAVPFVPLRAVPMRLSRLLLWSDNLRRSFLAEAGNPLTSAVSINRLPASHWLNDFTLSVSSKASSLIGWALFGIWLPGIFVMILLLAKSAFRLHSIKKSSLPLQNQKVRIIYQLCLAELKITGNIPVYTTAFLSSPVIVGLFRPCIYLPLHLLSDSGESGLRYMLLHELHHYKHKDALANGLMNVAWGLPLQPGISVKSDMAMKT